MKHAICLWLLLLSFGRSFGVIYHLNESEYSRLPRLFELEDYEACMEQPGGVYCVANVELYADEESELYTLIKEYSEFTLKHYNYSVIDRGVCVSRTCESYAAEIPAEPARALEGCLNRTIYHKYGLMARLKNVNCEKAEDKDVIKLDNSDYLFLGVFVALLVLASVGSLCDIYSHNKQSNSNDTVEQNYKKGVTGRDLLLCFSIPENYKRLNTTEQNNPRVDIFKSIHAFRTIVLYFTVFAHVTLLNGAGFNADPHRFEKAYESAVPRITFSGLNIVQVFFFFTGLLLTYFTQVSEETHSLSWKMIPKIIFQRWWRLTPSAAMLVAFSATWMRHLSSGPLWHTYITNGSSEQCRRYFWAHIFYFNNYIPEDISCAFQTWYIAADMQLFIVGIIVHFVIRNRSLTFKITTLVSLLLLSMASPALHVWWQDMDAFAMLKPELFRALSDANFRKNHIYGHNNLSSFLIGISAGYLIYYLQQQRVEYPNFKFGNILCWSAIPMYILLIFCGSLFYIDGERPGLALRMLYAATNRAIIGLIAAMWMVGVTLKFNGMSKAVMEWRGWVLPSRLSYNVYLLHNIFVELGLGTRTHLTPVSFFNSTILSIGVFVASYAIAVPFHLLIEAPTARLIKLSSHQKIDKKMD